MMDDTRLRECKAGLGSDLRTIAEVLKPAKYSNLPAWEMACNPNTLPGSPQHNWPRQRDIDRLFGTIHRVEL